MLFDLQADPYEKNNLAVSHPEVTADMLARLNGIEAQYRWNPNALDALSGKRPIKGGDDE